MTDFTDLTHLVRQGRHGWRATLDQSHHATAVLAGEVLTVRLKSGADVLDTRRYRAAAFGLGRFDGIGDAEVRLAMHEVAHDHFARDPMQELVFDRDPRDSDSESVDAYPPASGLYNTMGRTPWTRDLKLRPAD